MRATWFENMLFENGHKLVVGNPVLIRKRATSRHKNDRRDAELILELLLRDEFPALRSRRSANQDIMGNETMTNIASINARRDEWVGHNAP